MKTNGFNKDEYCTCDTVVFQISFSREGCTEELKRCAKYRNSSLWRERDFADEVCNYPLHRILQTLGKHTYVRGNYE